MKLTEFIEKLQGIAKELKQGCSHDLDLWNNISFILETKDNGYETGDYEFVEPNEYHFGYLNCGCYDGLTIGFKYEFLNKNEEKTE